MSVVTRRHYRGSSAYLIVVPLVRVPPVLPAAAAPGHPPVLLI